MTNIEIYNGDQIGGCVVTIQTEKTKIAIDFGENLPGSCSEKLEIEGLTYGNPSYDGVFFTHYHGDHNGRCQDILPGIPLYMGELSREVMLNINQTLQNEEKTALFLDDDRIQILEANKSESLNEGDIVITPYMVDHSAYEAFMFLIETPDKTILHTGDFREHGYRGRKGLIPMIDHYIRKHGKREIDILITEGTMMSRADEKLYSEEELQKDARELFKHHKYIFLLCSSTNLDSLASFYQAAKANGMYMYGNQYVYRQLKIFDKYAGKWSKLYQFDHVFPVDFEKTLKSSHGFCGTQEELMRKHGFVCIIKETQAYEKWIERFQDLNPMVIYSMWDGYITPGKSAYQEELAEFCKKYQVKHMHTSGHASASTIAKVITAISPKEAIIPIHTENAAGFQQLEISEELKRKVRILHECKRNQ